MDENKTTRTKGWIKYTLIVMVIVVWGLALVLFFIPDKEQTELICRFEQTVAGGDVPRHECTKMRIISNELGRVNMNKFMNLGIDSVECYDSIDDLPPCSGENIYFTQYPLKVFCTEENCEMDGTLCASYWVDYLEPELDEEQYQKSLEVYQLLFTEKEIVDEAELDTRLRACERR